ncbi:ketosteroid isomerase, partial [Rhizobium johnstonii]
MNAKHDMKKIVEEIYAVRDRGDVEATLALIGENCTFRMVGNTR